MSRNFKLSVRGWVRAGLAAVVFVLLCAVGQPASAQITTNPAPGYVVITNLHLIFNYGLRVGSDNTNKVPGELRYNAAYDALEYWSADTGGWALISSSGTYPVFVLEVGTYDGTWTDFALKLSLVNWSGAANSEYYFQSYVSRAAQPYLENVYGTNGVDTDCAVFFTDDYAANPRVWQQKGLDISIASQLISTNSRVGTVYVMPSHTGAGYAPLAAMWAGLPTNTQAVWSWARYDALGYEMNLTGTEIRWQPIQPGYYLRQRTEMSLE